MLDRYGSDTTWTQRESFDEEHYGNKLAMFNVTDKDRLLGKIKGDVYL